MSTSFQAVLWNRQKSRYDLFFLTVLLLGMASFVGTTLLTHPYATLETLIIRTTSVSALLLLHLILSIGPLARLDARFHPLLYNRRHLGVTMFLLAAIHGVFSLIQFNGGGNANPLVSLLTAYSQEYGAIWHHTASFSQFPFEILGLGALIILFFMAATSHDFWLKHLGPSVWKSLHLLVYLAYGLILTHVLLGALQSEKSWLYPVLLGAGFLAIVTLHVLAYLKERRTDEEQRQTEQEGYVATIPVRELQADVGQVVIVNGERLAVYLTQGKVYALSNVCRHQGGPLGEGRILYDCITCPWHGYQYRPEDGCSPPPFQEIVPTYRTKIIDGIVYIHPQPNPLKSLCEGTLIAQEVSEPTMARETFYIGWQDQIPPALQNHLRPILLGLMIGIPLLTGTLAWLQNPFEPGTYDYGVAHTFEGVVTDSPIALLEVFPPDVSSTETPPFNYVLVGTNKFGPSADFLRKATGHRVRFQGSYLSWNNSTMVEINEPDGLQILGPPPSDHPRTDARQVEGVRLTGELIDTKCYFGAMRPGEGKVHRACAIRCLSGGVPPGILVHDTQGRPQVILLAGYPGHPLRYDVHWAARIVSAEGTLEISPGLMILRTNQLSLAPE